MDQATTNPTAVQQVKIEPRRRLDHLTDLSDGFDQWDMIPRKLSRAYIDGKFPESKFRLLLCMMSHSGGFHIKRAYLEKRFSDKTLTKYCKELVIEGYIRVESLPATTGGLMNLYHVQPLSCWKLYAQIDDPIPNDECQTADPSLSGASLSGDHKDPNLKDPNLNLNPTVKTRVRDVYESERQAETRNPYEPTIGNPDHKEAIAKMVEDGRNQGLLIKPDDLARSIGLAIQNLQATFPAIQELWPIAVAGMLERLERNPATGFFNWIKADLAYKKRQRQNDERYAAKSIAGKNRRITQESIPAPNVELSPEEEELRQQKKAEMRKLLFPDKVPI